MAWQRPWRPSAARIYYNEIDADCCQWLQNLMDTGLIPYGVIDSRSIRRLRSTDFLHADGTHKYDQCHFFAGVGGWPLALRAAQWPDDFPVWTASCPCFAAGTLVLTELGYLPIEDLKVGDKVLTHRGRWRKINATMRYANAPLLRIRAQGVPDVITTPEHPFLAVQARRAGHFGQKEWGVVDWTKAGELKAGEGGHYLSQVLPKSRGFVRAHGFWYLIGRYLADGWRELSSDGKRVAVCCAKSESKFLEQAIKDAGFKGTSQDCGPTDRFVIHDSGLFSFLAVFGDKAHGKRIPRIALEQNEFNTKALIEGYMAGDGYRTKANNRASETWRATTVSRALALGIALLAQRSHGVVASVRLCPMPETTVIEGRTVNQRDFYAVSIPDRNRSATIGGDYGWKLIRQIESMGTGEVFNIGVEEDESYCADGALVHNCQPFSVAGKGRGTDDRRDLWPYFHGLLQACRPQRSCGEQVGQKAGYAWLSRVAIDLEAEKYRWESFDIPACSVGAPHIRSRLYWLADRLADQQGVGLRKGATRVVAGDPAKGRGAGSKSGGDDGRVADHNHPRLPVAQGQSGNPRPECETVERDCESADGLANPRRQRNADGRDARDLAGTPGIAEGIGEERQRLRDAAGDAGATVPTGEGLDLSPNPRPDNSQPRPSWALRFKARREESERRGGGSFNSSDRLGLPNSNRLPAQRPPSSPTGQRHSAYAGSWDDTVLVGPDPTGHFRRIEPSTPPLAPGLPRQSLTLVSRLLAMGLDPDDARRLVSLARGYIPCALRGYGNAICVPLAAEVLGAWLEVIRESE